MDVYMVILRLIHIVGGIFWVGGDLLMFFFVEPVVVALGSSGGAFMQRLTGHTRYAQVMPLASLLTVVSGVLLFTDVSGNFNRDWLISSSGVVLTLGAIAGLLAFLEGMVLIGPTAKGIEKLGKTLVEQAGPPSGEQQEAMHRLQIRMNRAYQYQIILTLLSVIGMASARYVWF